MTRGVHSFFTFLLCLLLDWLWLSVFAGNLLNFKPANWLQPTDLLFYAVFTSGLLMYSIYPALYQKTQYVALFYGAQWGFAVFGLRELINCFWYFNYPDTLAIVDTLWGTLAGAVLGFTSFQMGVWMRLSGSAEQDVAMDSEMF